MQQITLAGALWKELPLSLILFLYIFSPSGISASSSENSLCRARSFSNGSVNQQATPHVKTSPSFTFSSSHTPASSGGLGQSPRKGASRVLALVRGKLPNESVLGAFRWIWEWMCCGKRQP